jgi:hypothetical protein
MNDVSAAKVFDPRAVAATGREDAVQGESLALDTIRRRGMALTAGTLIWASTIFALGTVGGGWEGRVGDLGGMAFQLGVFALLTVMLKTRATGRTRAARAMLKVEFVLLGVATVWSLLHAVVPASMQDAPWLMAMDLFWPLSMVGMFVIGVKVALAGRWRGVLRWWPLVAESWAFITIPAMGLLGETGGTIVGGTHLIVGYATLGVLLARRPWLTRAA